MPLTTIEVLALSERDGCLRYRRLVADLREGVHPDDAARALSGLTACTPGGVLHSTSWRYEPGAIVLTYAALPDPRADLPTALVQTDAVATGAPLAPSPARLDIDAVAAHACRHLAQLAVTDYGIAGAAKAQPDLWELIAKA
ncbi:hypothetical protein [Allorhizocola rhizosphaerae]|uniref:hypothetical protein n=1 Tax=Allorhizocola rhizosphaerae TaxID=1872709 RepID=UPI000E3E3F9A|nr:hypothetical protein [Allorhizocola rhizosphaerae]